MAIVQVVVVIGAIQVGRHHADVLTVVLPVIALTKLDTGNLGDGVRFVGLL